MSKHKQPGGIWTAQYAHCVVYNQTLVSSGSLVTKSRLVPRVKSLWHPGRSQCFILCFTLSVCTSSFIRNMLSEYYYCLTFYVIRVTKPTLTGTVYDRYGYRYTLKNPIFESGRFLILFKLANTDLMPIFDKKYEQIILMISNNTKMKKR